MKPIELIIWAIVAFLSSVLDTSFLAFLDIFNSTVISSFCIVIVLAMLGYKSQSIYFGSFVILFLSAFSSIPIFALFIAYMAIPLLIIFLKQKIYFEAIPAVVVLAFLVSSTIFRLTLLTLGSIPSRKIISSLLSFPAINTLFGYFLLMLARRYILRFKGKG